MWSKKKESNASWILFDSLFFYLNIIHGYVGITILIRCVTDSQIWGYVLHENKITINWKEINIVRCETNWSITSYGIITVNCEWVWV